MLKLIVGFGWVTAIRIIQAEARLRVLCPGCSKEYYRRESARQVTRELVL